MEIWLKQDKTQFRFAVLPPEYELTSESNNTQVNVNALGEINLIGKRKLKNVSFSSFFPKQQYYFCQYTTKDIFAPCISSENSFVFFSYLKKRQEIRN